MTDPNLESCESGVHFPHPGEPCEEPEAAPRDRSRRYLVPVTRFDLAHEPDAVHLSVYEWNPRLQEWVTGWAICGRSSTQGALPDGTSVTCKDCARLRGLYEDMFNRKADRPEPEPQFVRQVVDALTDGGVSEIAAREQAADPCPSRLVHPDAQWACDRPAGHPGGHSAGERGAVGYQAWTDQAAGAVSAAECGPECAEQHTYGPGCGAQIHNGQTYDEPVVDEAPAPPASVARGDCGYERVTWDLGIPMRDHCTARAGHTDSSMAYEHGPWRIGPIGHQRQVSEPDLRNAGAAPAATALRDQIAETVHATSACEVGDPVRCGGGCRDAADAVLPVIEQHTARLRSQAAEAEAQAELIRGELVNTRRSGRAAEAALARARTLHADTERQLRADLADEVQKREAARNLHRPYNLTSGEQRCFTCASREAYPNGVAIHELWPCPTVQALDTIKET